MPREVPRARRSACSSAPQRYLQARGEQIGAYLDVATSQTADPTSGCRNSRRFPGTETRPTCSTEVERAGPRTEALARLVDERSSSESSAAETSGTRQTVR